MEQGSQTHVRCTVTHGGADSEGGGGAQTIMVTS